MEKQKQNRKNLTYIDYLTHKWHEKKHRKETMSNGTDLHNLTIELSLQSLCGNSGGRNGQGKEPRTMKEKVSTLVLNVILEHLYLKH